MTKIKLSLLAYPLVVLASLAAASAAFAGDESTDHLAATPSLKTRAEVRTELAQAPAGYRKVWTTDYNIAAATQSLKTRDEVRAELQADRNSGYAASNFGEDSGSFALSRVKSARQAGPVYAGSIKGSAGQ